MKNLKNEFFNYKTKFNFILILHFKYIFLKNNKEIDTFKFINE